jgi:hypothetical protein
LAVKRHRANRLELGFDLLLIAGLLVADLPRAVGQLGDKGWRG